jgi:hypothetical protein
MKEGTEFYLPVSLSYSPLPAHLKSIGSPLDLVDLKLGQTKRR